MYDWLGALAAGLVVAEGLEMVRAEAAVEIKRPVSLATTQAFLALAGGEGPGLKRLLYSAIRQSTIDRWNQNRLAMGRKPWDPTRVFELRGVPDETIGIDVDVSGVSERLVMAVREQLIGSLRRECWVIGWPQRAAGAPELRCVFEGL